VPNLKTSNKVGEKKSQLLVVTTTGALLPSPINTLKLKTHSKNLKSYQKINCTCNLLPEMSNRQTRYEKC